MSNTRPTNSRKRDRRMNADAGTGQTADGRPLILTVHRSCVRTPRRRETRIGRARDAKETDRSAFHNFRPFIGRSGGDATTPAAQPASEASSSTHVQSNRPRDRSREICDVPCSVCGEGKHCRQGKDGGGGDRDVSGGRPCWLRPPMNHLNPG